ncbi:MAG: hypothetical protein ACRC2M_10090, partial [Planktothrix sp.]
LSVSNAEVLNIKPIINGVIQNYPIKLQNDISCRSPEIDYNFRCTCKDIFTKWSTPLQLAKKAGNGAVVSIHCLSPNGVNIAVMDDQEKIFENDLGNLHSQFRKNRPYFDLSYNVFNSLAIWKDISLPGALTKIEIDPTQGIVITQDCGIYSELRFSIISKSD